VRRLGLLGLCVIAACDSSEPASAPQIDTKTRPARVAIESSSTANLTAPAEPVTVEQLVEDGRYWRFTTKNGPVHVWVPKGYRRKKANVVIYVHGFYTKVDAAWKSHALASQFASSALNAMFIACEAPASGAEPVSWTSLAELLSTVETKLAELPKRPKVKLPSGRVVAVGHSGAWRTLVSWLDEPKLDTVVLFDAAYGEIEKYKAWILGAATRRLITIGDTSTRKWTEQLHKDLPDTLVLDGFPDPEKKIPGKVKRAQIVYIRSTVGHFPLVTGHLALPLTLRTLRGKLLLDLPLADLLAAGVPEPGEDDE
jgi:hypothetical protein